MWGITDQNNSKYGHFLRSGIQERDHLQKQLFTGILENSSSENFGKFQGKKPWWCAVVDLHCECECFPGNFPKLKKLLKRLFRIAAFQFTDHSHSFYPLISRFYMGVTFFVVSCDVHVVGFEGLTSQFSRQGIYFFMLS